MKPKVAIDFETEKIERRPAYPPKPVGVAVYGQGVPARYYAWAHPVENNCTKAQARSVLARLYKTHQVVFHHSAYDCEVGHVHLDLPKTPDVFHDTLFLAFLFDPRAENLSLKPLAEKLLDMPADEQAQLRDWILQHVPEAAKKPKEWGAYIARAPGKLVGKYAIGDVKRTLALFEFFVDALAERDRRYPVDEGQQSQWDAYQREIKLMPVITYGMERRGIRVAVKRLARDLPKWERQFRELDNWIIKRLGGHKKVNRFAKDGEPFNVGSPQQLADALDAAGLITHWIKTPKGNRSVAKEALQQVIADRKVAEAIQKREVLEKYMNTYGAKWLAMADANGFVYPRINQVRNREDEAAGLKGARTGRLSYSDSWHGLPNVDRIPFSDLPVLRDYVIPDDDDEVFTHRDYTQQEFRILAHYEQGPLLERYQANPFIDMHTEALNMINELTALGLDPKKDRRPVKDTGFGLIYGMGLEKTAAKTKQTKETAKLLRDSYLAAIPGLKELLDEIKQRCKRDEPIRTWGGRLYWVEPPTIDKKTGRLKTFEYKMINVLIQGSAGDCTKEAMIRSDEALRAGNAGRMVIQVHDELNGSVKRAKLDKHMKLLREAMESVEFDVPMLSDGAWSARSWGALRDYNDRR